MTLLEQLLVGYHDGVFHAILANLSSGSSLRTRLADSRMVNILKGAADQWLVAGAGLVH